MATANEIEIRVTVDDKTKAPFRKIETKLKADAEKVGKQGGQAAGGSFTTAFGKATSKDWFNGKANNPFGQLSKAAEFAGGAAAARAKLAFEKGMADFGKDDARFGLIGKGGLFAGMFDGIKAGASSAFSTIASAATGLGGALAKVAGPATLVVGILGGVGAIAGPAVIAIGAIAAAVGGSLLVALGAGVGALGLFNVKAREAFTGLGEHIQNSLARLTDQSGLTGTFQKMAAVLKTTFLNLRTEIKQLMIDVQPLLMQLAAGLSQFANTLVPRIGTAIKNLGPVFQGFSTMLGNLGVGLGDMFIKLSEHATGFGETFAGLGEVFRQVLPALGSFMGVIADQMGPALQTLAPLLADFVEKLGPLLATAIRQVTPMLPGLFEGFNQIMAALIPLIPPLTQLAVDLLPVFAAAIQAAGEIINTFLIPAIGLIAPALEVALVAVRAWVGSLKAGWQLMTGDFQGAMQTMTEVTNGTFMQAMPEAANAGFEQVKAAGHRGMEGLNTEVTAGFQNAVEGTMTGTQNILNGILGFQGRFESGGASLGAAFKRGIINQINSAVDAVQAGVERIAGLFGNSPAKWGPFSGRGYTKYRGQRLMEAFAHGIRKGNAKLKTAGKDAMGNTAFSIFGHKHKRGRNWGKLASGSISGLPTRSAYSGAGAPSASMLGEHYRRQTKQMQAGMRNVSASQITVTGDADGAIATMIAKLIRSGKLRIA